MYTFAIPGAPADHRARAFALWDAAPHASIAVPLDVDDDLARASFASGERMLGALPRHRARAALWLRDIVDGVRAALAFGFSRFRAAEITRGRASLIFGVDEEWAPPGRVGVKHRLVGELFGFPGHRAPRASLALLPPSVAAAAGSDHDDIDALSSSLASYFASPQARADAHVDEFRATGVRTSLVLLARQLALQPELVAFADVADDIAGVHGADLIARVGQGAPFVPLLSLLPALDTELIDVVTDADRGAGPRANAALVLGWKRNRAAAPALLALLRDAHDTGDAALASAALEALALIPGERGLIVDDTSGTLTPCPHDFRSLMPMQAELRRACPDCRAVVTPARLLRRRKLQGA